MIMQSKCQLCHILVQSLGLHPKAAIQPDGLTVDHFVQDDVLDQVGVLVRIAESGWTRHLLGQERTNLSEQERERCH